MRAGGPLDKELAKSGESAHQKGVKFMCLLVLASLGLSMTYAKDGHGSHSAPKTGAIYSSPARTYYKYTPPTTYRAPGSQSKSIWSPVIDSGTVTRGKVQEYRSAAANGTLNKNCSAKATQSATKAKAWGKSVTKK